MNDLRTRPSLLRRTFTTDDRAIGIHYLLLSLVAVAAGTLLSLAMRTQLAWPGIHWPLHGPMLPEEYLSLVTMHGTLMVFFVLTTAPQSGFASLVLAAQIGARRMAMPWLNALGFWIVALALAVLLSTFLLPAGGLRIARYGCFAASMATVGLWVTIMARRSAGRCAAT